MTEHHKNIEVKGAWHMANRRDSDTQLSELELRIVEGFVAIRGKQDALLDRMDACNEVQQKLLEAVYGNGKVGLITKVATIETKQVSIKWIVTVLSTTLLGMAAYIIQRSVT